MCNRMYQHLCTCYKSQTQAAIPLFGHTKILHTLVGLGNATPAAVVCSLFQVRWPEFPARHGIKNNNNKQTNKKRRKKEKKRILCCFHCGIYAATCCRELLQGGKRHRLQTVQTGLAHKYSRPAGVPALWNWHLLWVSLCLPCFGEFHKLSESQTWDRWFVICRPEERVPCSTPKQSVDCEADRGVSPVGLQIILLEGWAWVISFCLHFSSARKWQTKWKWALFDWHRL